MKKLSALVAILLIIVSTSTILSPVKAVSSAGIEFKQPTYAYKGSTRQIEVKVSNTGTETINNLWLGVDLVHRLTRDDETDRQISSAYWEEYTELYSFAFSEKIERLTVQVMAMIDSSGEGIFRVYWTPTAGSETQIGNDVQVTETTYMVKTLILDQLVDSSGTLSIRAHVRPFDSLLNDLLTDWAVVSATQRVEATKTPIKPSGASDYGGFNFDPQQGLALTPGATKTFATTYTFSRSNAYSYDYDYGAYYWDMAVWKDGYPGQGSETAVVRAQKPFTIPYTFDMTVSIEWAINPTDTGEKGPSFVNHLVAGLKKASEYLFDATDGQMCFSKITIFDNKEHWADCDLRIHEETDANNILDAAWPKTSPSLEWAWPPIITHIEMGRKWIYQGMVVFDSWDQDWPSAIQPAYRTLIHEFGHFKLGLLDEYMHDPLSYNLGQIADMIIHNNLGTAHCTDSLMDDQTFTSEFCNPANHDPDKDTWQEFIHGKSCWSTIKEKYPWIYIPMQVKPGPDDKVGKDISFDLGGRSGGPDYFGYTYLDSNSLLGPAYDWIELKETGGIEVLPDSDDAWVGNINLGFFFNYYGTDYSQLAIGNNGLLFSGVGTSQYINQPITQTPSIHGLIAPYWDDIVTWGSAGAVYYETRGTAPNRKFVVEWYDNQHYYSSSSGITFEAILYEGTNNILFQYKDIDFGSVSGAVSGDNPPYNNGGSATVGIEDPTGNIGLQYSFNEQAITPNLAILFKFPAFAGTNMYLSMNAPASMDHGNTMVYTLYYNDFGDVVASNVVLQATLSPNVDFVPASDGGTYDSITRTVTWNIGTVPAFPLGRGSRTITVTIPASVPVGTVIQATASISTSTLETRYDDNDASAQTTVTGSNLPPNVGVGPTLGNSGGTPMVYWTTPITFTYHDPTATGVDIRIHLDDGRPDITGSMTGGPPTWTYTVTFYPRCGHATVTYTVHGPTPQTVNFNIYVDPAGYIYDVVTLARISGASVWLQHPDGEGGWENVPTGQTPPIMQPDVNPQITGADGQYQWDVLEGSYRVHVEASGYYPADSIVVTIPPPVTDLHVGLTPLPPPADDIPPTTTLIIGNPKYIDPSGNIYVASNTPFTLSAEDNLGGTGVASTFYRIYNSTYDTGSLEYSASFYLTGLADGEYSIDYYSTDNIGNTEPTNTATVILDNTPPTTTLTIGEPKYISDTTYVTPDTPFTLEAADTGSGVYSTAYRICNATYDSGWITCAGPVYLTSLTSGTYTIEYNSTDNVQNTETTHTTSVTLFHWNYIYQDTSGRGTTLKINTAHKFFQFIAPSKDYGIRNATSMRQCGRAIIINHSDKQLRLITASVDTKIDFCYAMAWDLQTRKCYLLIDKAGIE